MSSQLGSCALTCSSCTSYCFRNPGGQLPESIRARMDARYLSCKAWASGVNVERGVNDITLDAMSNADFSPVRLRILLDTMRDGIVWTLTKAPFAVEARLDSSSNRMTRSSLQTLPLPLLKPSALSSNDSRCDGVR